MTRPKVEPAPVEPLAVSIAEAASLLGISESSLRRMIEAGVFPSVRIGSRQVVPLAGARAWLAERTLPRPEEQAS